MSAELIDGFLLYVDDKPTSVHGTFQAADDAAGSHKHDQTPLKICTTSSPIVRSPGGSLGVLPVREWNFAHDLNQWVESLH